MTPEEEKELTEQLDAIAKILYRQAKPEQVKTLAQIETKVREQTLQYITPQFVENLYKVGQYFSFKGSREIGGAYR